MRSLAVAALLLGLAACTANEPEVDAAPLADCGCVPDTPLDTSTAPCAACTADQICVQLLNGPCGTASVTCRDKVAGCDQPACSTECDQAYCDPGGFSTCFGPSCPEDIPGALHCYGI